MQTLGCHTHLYSELRGEFLTQYREIKSRLNENAAKVKDAQSSITQSQRRISREDDGSSLIVIGWLFGFVGFGVIGLIGALTDSGFLLRTAGIFAVLSPVLLGIGANIGEREHNRVREARLLARWHFDSVIVGLESREAELHLALQNLLKDGLRRCHKDAELALLSGSQDLLSRIEFVESYRALLEYERGGKIGLYDEAKIQSDLMALTARENLTINGNHVDNRSSIYVDTVNHSQLSAVIEPQPFIDSEPEVKREAIRIAHESGGNGLSIIEFLCSIKTSPELARRSIDSLVQQGILVPINRENGSIAFVLDYLHE